MDVNSDEVNGKKDGSSQDSSSGGNGNLMIIIFMNIMKQD